MRIACRLSCLLSFVLLASLAPTSLSGQNTGGDNSAGSGAPITVEGCIGSMNGHISLVTPKGTYRLKGDHDTLLDHNGKQVRVTGTFITGKKSGLPTIQVSDITTLSDTCLL